VDEEVQGVHVGLIAQHIIGAAAHDDARPLGSHPSDNLRLGNKDLVVDGQALGAHIEVVEKAAGFLLLGTTDEIGGEPGFLGGHVDDGAVEEGDAQGLGGLLGDETSAGAVFAAHGDNSVCHTIDLLVASYGSVRMEKV
jgi:hypothetical protein